MILENFEIFGFSLTEIEWLSIDWDATIASTGDSIEDFDSHWPRAKSLDRPKLEIARVDRLENPK